MQIIKRLYNTTEQATSRGRLDTQIRGIKWYTNLNQSFTNQKTHGRHGIRIHNCIHKIRHPFNLKTFLRLSTSNNFQFIERESSRKPIKYTSKINFLLLNLQMFQFDRIPFALDTHTHEAQTSGSVTPRYALSFQIFMKVLIRLLLWNLWTTIFYDVHTRQDWWSKHRQQSERKSHPKVCLSVRYFILRHVKNCIKVAYILSAKIKYSGNSIPRISREMLKKSS